MSLGWRWCVAAERHIATVPCDCTVLKSTGLCLQYIIDNGTIVLSRYGVVLSELQKGSFFGESALTPGCAAAAATAAVLDGTIHQLP